MAVNIVATFKKDSVHLNGLEAIHDDLLADPTRTVLIVAEVEVKRIVEDVDDGTKTPRVRLRAIEPVLADEDIKTVRGLLDAAYAARTGRDNQPTLFDRHAVGEDDGPVSPEPDEWLEDGK